MHESLNERLVSIWRNAIPLETRSRLPLFFTQLKHDSLLFVGLNPSFSDKGFKKILTGKHQGLDYRKFYKFPSDDPIDFARHQEIEKQSFEQHPYFSKFKDISARTGIGWDHIDLFAVRETNQAGLKNHLIDPTGKMTLFGSQQLELSKLAIESSRPKVIVVANALASRIFEKEFDAKFDESAGYHIVLIDGRKTPVFLTSMLTGQRALDTFSYQRLRWQIAQAIGGRKEVRLH